MLSLFNRVSNTFQQLMQLLGLLAEPLEFSTKPSPKLPRNLSVLFYFVLLIFHFSGHRNHGWGRLDGWTVERLATFPMAISVQPRHFCTDLLRLFSFFDKIKNLKNDKKTKPNCFSGKSQTNVTMPSVKVGHGFESEQDTIKEN